MNGVVQVYAAPTPSLSPTPGGLWVFFFKCQAEHFEHWLESIIHRQIFRRVLSSLDAEDVCPQQPSLLCFGVRLKKSRERLKMSKFVVKVRYPLFGLVSFQVHLMLLLPHVSSPPSGVQEVAVEEHPSLHKHGQLPVHQGQNQGLLYITAQQTAAG